MTAYYVYCERAHGALTSKTQTTQTYTHRTNTHGETHKKKQTQMLNFAYFTWISSLTSSHENDILLRFIITMTTVCGFELLLPSMLLISPTSLNFKLKYRT